MSAADNLRAARALIEDPKHWTQWKTAGDKNGKWVSAGSPLAVCFCMGGALERGKVEISPLSSEIRLLGAVIASGKGDAIDRIIDLNDTHTHAEVLAAFDKAIELAETQQ